MRETKDFTQSSFCHFLSHYCVSLKIQNLNVVFPCFPCYKADLRLGPVVSLARGHRGRRVGNRPRYGPLPTMENVNMGWGQSSDTQALVQKSETQCQEPCISTIRRAKKSQTLLGVHSQGGTITERTPWGILCIHNLQLSSVSPCEDNLLCICSSG